MNINWTLRFKNKVTLTAIVVQVIAIIYAMLGVFNIVPSLGENVVLDIAYMVIELLCLLGIVVDPTTEGLSDSEQALTYIVPREGNG